MSSSLNESIVEDAALTWFGELGHAVGQGPRFAPGELAAERNSFADVVLLKRFQVQFNKRSLIHPRRKIFRDFR